MGDPHGRLCDRQQGVGQRWAGATDAPDVVTTADRQPVEGCRRDATHAAFRGEWLRTGDVDVRSTDGYYTFLGRNNDMIKTGGIWVSPAEVEGVLVEHPDVLEAAVVGARDEEGLETTVAFVVPRSGHTIAPGSVDAHCRQRMAAFKRPRRLVEVGQLPKTPTGKIRRFALREQLAADA